MDPQQDQPTSNDPYQQPAPPAGYSPPPSYTDYTQVGQQHQAPSIHDAYAQPQPDPTSQTPPAEQPINNADPTDDSYMQPNPATQLYGDEQAVAYARAKVEAAHVDSVHAQPQTPAEPIQSHPQDAAVQAAEPIAANHIPPAQPFANYQLPDEDAEQHSAEPLPAAAGEAAEPETSVPFEPGASAVEATAEQPGAEAISTVIKADAKTKKQQYTGIKGKVQRFYRSFFVDGKFRIPHQLKPFFGAALTGLAVFAIFNSQVILGQIQYIINPGNGNSANVSAAISEQVGPENLIIIPKINVSAPVVYDVTTFNEQAVQKGLERGVVHYGNTALPGQIGNNVIVGHSSNNWWASGKYKFAFVLLDKLEVGDTFILNYNSKRYIYEVSAKKVVDPKDVSVLDQSSPTPITTLITCTPAGTSLNRLIVVGKQISPNPSTDTTRPAAVSAPNEENILPGNTPSIIDKIREFFN